MGVERAPRHDGLDRRRPQAVDHSQPVLKLWPVPELDRQHVRVDRRSVEPPGCDEIDGDLMPAGIDHLAEELVRLPQLEQPDQRHQVTGMRIGFVECPRGATQVRKRLEAAVPRHDHI